MRSAIKVTLLLSAVGLLSCSTVGGVKKEALDEGKARTYQAGHDKVFNAARKAVVEAGLGIDQVYDGDEKTRVLMCTKGMGVTSYGEVIRVAVEKTTDSVTTVRVVTKKRMKTNIFARGDWSKKIFPLIEISLGLKETTDN